MLATLALAFGLASSTVSSLPLTANATLAARATSVLFPVSDATSWSVSKQVSKALPFTDATLGVAKDLKGFTHKIVKAPDGSLNRAALAGASLAKERRELRQQEANEQADSEARDFSAPWLDPMAKEGDRVFAQDLRRDLRGQKAGEQPKWKEATFNKATTFGEITSLSIQDQRKSLPIYKLRDALLQAVREVSDFSPSRLSTCTDC